MGNLAAASTDLTAALARVRANHVSRLPDSTWQPTAASRRNFASAGPSAGAAMGPTRRRSGCAGGCDDWSDFALLAAQPAIDSSSARYSGRKYHQVDAGSVLPAATIAADNPVQTRR